MVRWSGWLAWAPWLGLLVVACQDGEDRFAEDESSKAGEAGTGAGSGSAGATGALGGGTHELGGAPHVSGAAGAPEPLAGAAGDTSVSVPGPPVVVSVEPQPDADDAEPDASIRITFSEPLDPDSVVAASVVLMQGGAPVLGTVTLDGATTVVFEPASRLSLSSQYDAVVSAEIEDATGEALGTAFELAFSTRVGVWQEPLVAPHTPALFDYVTRDVSLGMDAEGNVLLGYQEVVFGRSAHEAAVPYARWYHPETGLEAASPLIQVVDDLFWPDEDPKRYFLGPHVAVAKTGEATAVYGIRLEHLNPDFLSRWRAETAFYRDGVWQRKELGSVVKHDLYGPSEEFWEMTTPQLSVAGDEAIFWWRWSGQRQLLNAGILDGSEASGQTLTAASAGESVEDVTVGMDGAGNALMLTRRTDATTAQLECFGRSAGQAWHARAVDTSALTPVAGKKALVLDGSGGGMLLLARGGVGVWASRYTAAAGFAEPVLLHSLALEVDFLSPGAVATNGEDFVAAYSHELEGAYSIHVSTYSGSTSAWSNAVELSDSATQLPRVAMDAHGNAVVVWAEARSQGEALMLSRRNAHQESFGEPQVVRDGLEAVQLNDLGVANNGIVAFIAESSEADALVTPRLYVFQ